MKIKTFILTFLMMMSSPFLFGEQTTGANYAWGDAPYSQHKAMMSAKLNLDGVTDYSIYEIGAFCGDEIRGKQRANSTGDFFLSIMLKESSEEISFRLYNHEADLEIFNVYKTTTLSDGAHIGGPGNSVDVSATYVAKIGNAAYPTIEKAIAAAQEGETVTILEGNYTQNLDINKAITVQGERNDQDENLVNITGKLNITANNATAKNLNVDNGNGNDAYINAKNVTVDGCTVDGGNGFRSCYTTGLVTFKNSTITGDVYGIHFDGSAGGEIVIDNCVITGWTSFAKTITKVTMKGTSFEKGNYNYVRFYQNEVVIEDCTFNENMAIDIAVDDNTTTIDDCTFTNNNIEDLFYDEDIVNSTIIVDGTTLKREASIGDTYYETLAEALEAVKDMSGEVTINLLSDATLDITAWQDLAIGGENTTKIIIDGENGENDFTLTFNKKNSDWSHIATSNDNATDLVLQNIKITDSGYNNGPWNRYDINFACDVELNNVVSTKALAFKAGATLNNVTINEIGDNYAIWIQPNGQNVAIDGLVINSAGRGIKVDEQYVTAQNVNLSVANATFTTVKKAAIMVKSAANTAITVGVNVNISGVSADQTNIAWVDEDAAAHYGKVTVTGGTLGQESMPSFVAALMNGEKVDGYYKTLPEAITAQTGSEIVKVLKDATGAGAKINKDITIDFNEKTYTFNEGVGSGDLTSNGFQLLGGNVVLKNGTLKVADADASEFYILVQNYTDLTVENMTLDGTNLDKWSTSTNPNDGDSYVLSNNSGTVNIIGETNITANDESSANPSKAFAFDVYDKKSSGYEYPTVNVETTGKIDGRIEVSSTISNNLNISGGTFTVEIKEAWCANGFIPVKNDDNTWTVKVGQYVARIGETGYENLDDAFAAAQNGNEVKILVAGTYAVPTGKNITITGAVDGVVFDMPKNNYSYIGVNAGLTFNNVTFDYGNYIYVGLAHCTDMVYNNCIINGQVFLYGTSETFNNCTFNQNSADAYNVWTYGADVVNFNECIFNSVGKSVLIYSDQKEQVNIVNVNKCQLIASTPVTGKAAFEMDSSIQESANSITLNITETTATGFGSGNVSGNSLWNNKKGNQGANNDITVTVDDVVVLAPTTVAKIGETEYNTLQGAITAAGTTTTQIEVVGSTTENINIAEGADITLAFAQDVTLNGYFAPFIGNLTINGGTINNTNSGASAIEINAGELNLNNVNIASARHAVRIDGAVTATINGGEYTLTATSGTRHAVNVSGGAEVTIKAGTFVGPKGTTMDSGSAVCVQASSKVTIEGGDFSGGKNATLGVTGTMIVTGGTFDQDPTVYVAEGYVVENNEGVYSVVPGSIWNSIIDKKYATLQEAIDEANANDVIVLLKGITENVTISKNLTIDGDDFNYTGNIFVDNSVNSNVEATIKNVNFVNGTGYAIKTDRIKSITVENCTVNNYSFLYANKSTLTVVVKNVEVKNGNYGFHWSNGTTATLENVIMTSVEKGLYIQNNASKTINLKNCNITNIAIWEKASANQTFNFEGTNTVGTLSSSQYAKYVLAAADATLKAPEGSTVTTSVDGYDVKYEGGVYKVVANNVMIEGTGATFATIQEAINAAQTGDKVVLLENIELTEADCVVGADRKVLVDVANKDITLDMNGKKISVTHMDEFTNDYIVAVIRVGDGAGLTVTGNGIIDVKTLDNNPDIAYMFWKRGTTGHLTILNGTFRMNDAADSMVYTNGNEIVFIEGGNWTLDAYGTRGNREPWIFNVQGAGDNHVLVRGGTFNADINRQHWSNEVIVPETHYTEVNTENIDDEEITTYTVKEGAEAYVNTGMLTGPYFAPKNIGYATLEEAIAAAVEFRDSPVTLLKDVELEETVIINGNGQESLTIDFAGKVVTSSASPAFRIQDDANVIVTNGNTNTNAYNFILGDSNATSAGNLTIVSGKFHGTTSVVSVTKGHLNITGGEFSVEPYQGNYAYLINCIDANYNNETATVAISGGTFHNWNPQNNAAEGPGTSFCAPGYGAISNGNGTWTVVEAKDVALVRNNEIIEQFASIQAAIDKAQDGDVIKVLEDITLGYEDAEQMCDDNYRSFINVDGKTVTIDLNGCMVKAELGEELEVNYVYGMVTTENEANLTIEDNSEEKTGTMWIDNAVDVYSLVMQYDGSIITINSGNYKLNVGGNGRGMIYSNDDEKVTVNGGNLWLGNVGTKDNGSPWIFNASGTGGKQIIVTGGTYNADINRQHWSDEVFVPETHYTANIGEGTYTIKEGAEAYVNTGMLTGPYYYRKNIGYATLEEAVAAAVDFKDSPVKLLKDVELTETIVINGNGQDLTIDFNEKQVTSSASPAFRIQKDANVIVMNGNMNTENYNFILGASDATSAGNLTIESGNYKGASSVVSVTNGLLTINGGEFEANESEWGSQYLINCIDRYNINGSGIALVSITGGKFHAFNPEDNTAENPQVNFCAQGYGAVETAAGSNIWEVMPVHTHDFYTGWRWYSTYIDINGSEGLIKLEDALEDKGLSINHNVDGFVTYEDGMWWNELATLKETNVKNMYKIEVSGDLEMKLIGNVVDFNEAIEIKTGYNWIGYPFTKAVNLNEAFAETFEPAEGDYMISQFQFAFYYNGSWNGSLVSLNPGEGYIYERVDDDTELRYNVNNINRNVVKTNISTEDNKWTPNARMYPNNMTMIAVVDGAIGDNYEVAAFVNGEVRGSARPIYIEALDAYMMFLTIHGDEVEEMSFMYYDLTTGESYMLNDRFDYTNDAHLGSVKEPYVFSRGTTGIGDAAMSQVNIYPNPTTTGTEINLEAVCDTVEVFNALGVKVAEYQNVDSIDALETAGIYVIRITNDGNVQNCRLVVK